jgi:hypothetical protein
MFMAVLGPAIAAVERKAHKAPFLVKGADLRKRDRAMTKLLAYDAFIEIDFARFDTTIGVELLEAERKMTTRPFPRNLYPELHRAYDLMMRTNGASRHGTTYARDGGRNSGDLTTSIGNGLLNRLAIWGCLRKLPRGAWISFHEGDDGIIGIRSDYVEEAKEALNFLWVYGLNAKLDIYCDIHQTSFCGRFLAQTPEGLKSYADPLRTMAKLHVTCATGDVKELMCAKALSYLHTDHETPVIGPWAYAVSTILKKELSEKRLRRALQRLLTTRELPWFYREALMRSPQLIDAGLSSRPSRVDEELRAAFSLRTGISIKRQYEMEACFTRWVKQGFVDDGLSRVEISWVWKPNVHYNINPH